MSEQFGGVGPAAEILGLSATTIRRLADTGRLPVWRTPGGQRRIDLQAVRQLRDELRAALEGELVLA